MYLQKQMINSSLVYVCRTWKTWRNVEDDVEGNIAVCLGGSGRDWWSGGRLFKLFLGLRTFLLVTSMYSFVINKNEENLK